MFHAVLLQFFQAFPLFPLVFLPISYFRSWAIPNQAKYVNMSYTCGLGRPGIDLIKPLAGKPVFNQGGLLVVHFLQQMHSLLADVKIIFSSKYQAFPLIRLIIFHLNSLLYLAYIAFHIYMKHFFFQCALLNIRQKNKVHTKLKKLNIFALLTRQKNYLA